MAPTTTLKTTTYELRSDSSKFPRGGGPRPVIEVKSTDTIAEVSNMVTKKVGFPAKVVRPYDVPASTFHDGALASEIFDGRGMKSLQIAEYTPTASEQGEPAEPAPDVANKYSIAKNKTSGTSTRQTVMLTLPPSGSKRPVDAKAEENESTAGTQNLLMLSPELVMFLAQSGKINLDLGGSG